MIDEGIIIVLNARTSHAGFRLKLQLIPIFSAAGSGPSLPIEIPIESGGAGGVEWVFNKKRLKVSDFALTNVYPGTHFLSIQILAPTSANAYIDLDRIAIMNTNATWQFVDFGSGDGVSVAQDHNGIDRKSVV